MKGRIYAAGLAALLPALAFAQTSDSYECTHGDLKRRVEIFHETGVPVPCEVHYFRETGDPGEREVLWRALNETGYCERKAREFRVKLEGMGWDCGPGDEADMETEVNQPSEAMDEMPPGDHDDTEALIPAEPTEPDQR